MQERGHHNSRGTAFTALLLSVLLIAMSLSSSRSPRSPRTSVHSCCDVSVPQSERFGDDGCPRTLQAFLDSIGPNLYFRYRQSRKVPYQSLEDDCDRRVMGHATKFEMVSGKFELPDEATSHQLVEGKYSLAPLYKVELSTELVCHVGVVAGERVPVITDRNPHLETLMDSRRAVYLPHTEDANMVVDLPNMSGMFFTTQRLTGADVYVCYDRTLHKFWVVVINSVYNKQNMCPDYGTDQEKLWKKLVEFQAYNDRVLELLARLGNHIKIIFRLSCAPTLKEDPASRLNDYFRDELTSERDVESSYYLYQRSGMLWGQYTEGTWHFGLKDLSNTNGVRLTLSGQGELGIIHKPIRFPL